MEDKSRKWFAIIIALIMVAAVFYSFAINLFGDTPSVTLVDTGSQQGGETAPGGIYGSLLPVELTPETVQSAVATLERYPSYQRTLTVEYLRNGESLGVLSAAVAVDGGWTRTDVGYVGGVTEHSILGAGSCWLWYGEGPSYVTMGAADMAADLAQRIPTYEDVLALDRQWITAAGYESRGDLPCIYVEVYQEELGYREKYWISVGSGLLVSAETYKEDQLVYQMTGYQVNRPLASGGDNFTLPDGTVLHQPED